MWVRLIYYGSYLIAFIKYQMILELYKLNFTKLWYQEYIYYVSLFIFWIDLKQIVEIIKLKHCPKKAGDYWIFVSNNCIYLFLSRKKNVKMVSQL
jgi:hypothetical protein